MIIMLVMDVLECANAIKQHKTVQYLLSFLDFLSKMFDV